MGGGGLDGQFYERMVSFTKNLWCCIREKVKHEYLISTSNNQRLEKCVSCVFCFITGICFGRTTSTSIFNFIHLYCASIKGKFLNVHYSKYPYIPSQPMPYYEGSVTTMPTPLHHLDVMVTEEEDCCLNELD